MHIYFVFVVIGYMYVTTMMSNSLIVVISIQRCIERIPKVEPFVRMAAITTSCWVTFSIPPVQPGSYATPLPMKPPDLKKDEGVRSYFRQGRNACGPKYGSVGSQ